METIDLEKVNAELAQLRTENAQLKAENAQLKAALDTETAKNQALESEIVTPASEDSFQLDGKTHQFQHKSFIHKGKFLTYQEAQKDETILRELVKTRIVKAI